jgi:hypothetical protein
MIDHSGRIGVTSPGDNDDDGDPLLLSEPSDDDNELDSDGLLELIAPDDCDDCIDGGETDEGSTEDGKDELEEGRLGHGVVLGKQPTSGQQRIEWLKREHCTGKSALSYGTQHSSGQMLNHSPHM